MGGPTITESKDREPNELIDKNMGEVLTDELCTPPPSDDDTLRGSWAIEFNATTIDESQLYVRLLYKDVYQFREVLKNFTIKDGKDITFIKNEKARITADCK